MNPTRLTAFSEAYAPAILQAIVESGVHIPAGETAQTHALGVTMDMLDMIQAKGVESVEHYFLNTRGGAFRLTCKALGIENSVRAMQNFLEG